MALADLEFSRKRIAGDVRKCVMSAVANAENNHGLDVNELVVAEAYVGKNLVMKRFHARGAAARARSSSRSRRSPSWCARSRRRRPARRPSNMGQKVNPVGLRVGINRTWDSRWFAGRASTAACCTRT